MRRDGFTLFELLVGAALFSLILTLVAYGLQVSQKAVVVSNEQVPVEILLQNAVDSATRLIRESKDVLGGEQSLQLTQWDGRTRLLSFANHTLSLEGTPLQANLDDVDFVVEQGQVIKIVIMTVSASGKTLIASASLRNVPAGFMKLIQANPPPDQPRQNAPNNPGQRPIHECPCCCPKHCAGDIVCE